MSLGPSGEVVGDPGCENLLREAPVGVLCLSGEGRILRISPCLEEWLAIDARAWEGRTIQELSGHPRLAGCLDPLWNNPERETLLEAVGDRWLRMHRQPVAGETRSCWAIYVTDVTPEARRAERLEQTAEHDELTGLANRRGFHRRFAALLKAAARHGFPVGVIYLDIDDFKAINDRFGHATGDMVLRELARFLDDNLRAEDIAARFGGEELVVALSHAGPEGAMAKAEQIRSLVAAHGFGDEDGRAAPRLTVSGGVAAGTPEAVAGAEGIDAWMSDLLAEADHRLYTAKRAGKNRMVGASGEADERA